MFSNSELRDLLNALQGEIERMDQGGDYDGEDDQRESDMALYEKVRALIEVTPE